MIVSMYAMTLPKSLAALGQSFTRPTTREVSYLELVTVTGVTFSRSCD
jgi:hypothetical protein